MRQVSDPDPGARSCARALSGAAKEYSRESAARITRSARPRHETGEASKPAVEGNARVAHRTGPGAAAEQPSRRKSVQATFRRCVFRGAEIPCPMTVLSCCSCHDMDNPLCTHVVTRSVASIGQNDSPKSDPREGCASALGVSQARFWSDIAAISPAISIQIRRQSNRSPGLPWPPSKRGAQRGAPRRSCVWKWPDGHRPFYQR